MKYFSLLLFVVAAQAQAFEHSHQAWDALLRKHVVLFDGGKASQVSYAGMAQDRAALKAYLQEMSQVDQGAFSRWTKAEQVAFLINAYNAFTVEKILTRYPNLKSIWDFGRFFTNPFRDPFISLFGAKMSLDTLEHELLRKKYPDPRNHYALNCASIGCPMLREEAYVAARLEEQLDEQAARFLSDRSRNRVRGGRLEVSKIFDWFKEDFEPLDAYFARYARLLADDPGQQRLVLEQKAAVRFLDYDWALNDSRSSSPR